MSILFGSYPKGNCLYDNIDHIDPSDIILLLEFEDNKIEMARKSGKTQKE